MHHLDPKEMHAKKLDGNKTIRLHTLNNEFLKQPIANQKLYGHINPYRKKHSNKTSRTPGGCLPPITVSVLTDTEGLIYISWVQTLDAVFSVQGKIGTDSERASGNFL